VTVIPRFTVEPGKRDDSLASMIAAIATMTKETR